MINAFSFPLSLLSQSVLMVLPSIAYGRVLPVFLHCFFPVALQVHVRPFHHIKKGPFLSWKAHRLFYKTRSQSQSLIKAVLKGALIPTMYYSLMLFSLSLQQIIGNVVFD